MAGIEELLVSIVSKFDDAGFKQLDKSTTKANKSTALLSKNLRGLFVGVIGAVGAKEILDASIRLESLKKSFEAISGTKLGAEEQLKFIREESDRLGLSVSKTVEAYRKLYVAGKSQGLEDIQIQHIYSGTMEYATANQLKPEETQQLLTAVDNLLIKNQVSAKALTGQLGKVMPEALQIAQRAMGKTDAEFKKLIKDGLKSSDLLVAMGMQLQTEFGEKALKNADTVQGALNKIGNAFTAIKQSILNEEGMEEVKKLLKEIVNILNSPATKKTVELLAKALTLVLKNIRLIGGIAAIMGIKRLIAQLAVLRMEFLTTSFAAGSLGAAMQMDAGIASIKAATKASWGLLAPWLRILAILLLVIEAWDTLHGKRTVTNEFMPVNPVVPKTVNKQIDKVKEKNPLVGFGTQMATNSLLLSPAFMPIGTAAKALENFNKNNVSKNNIKEIQTNKNNTIQRTQEVKNTTNNNTFTFNIQSTNPQGVSDEVRRAMLGVFSNFGTSKGYNFGTNQ